VFTGLIIASGPAALRLTIGICSIAHPECHGPMTPTTSSFATYARALRRQARVSYGSSPTLSLHDW
jgi:hypothetical protein